MHPRDQLTAKEIQVATLVWEGLTNRDIAKVIGTTGQWLISWKSAPERLMHARKLAAETERHL